MRRIFGTRARLPVLLKSEMKRDEPTTTEDRGENGYVLNSKFELLRRRDKPLIAKVFSEIRFYYRPPHKLIDKLIDRELFQYRFESYWQLTGEPVYSLTPGSNDYHFDNDLVSYLGQILFMDMAQLRGFVYANGGAPRSVTHRGDEVPIQICWEGWYTDQVIKIIQSTNFKQDWDFDHPDPIDDYQQVPPLLY